MKNPKMIYHSLASVTLPNDLSHALNRLTEDAMSTDANVYPTGIEGIYGSHRDTDNDNTEQWQHDDAQHDLTDAEHTCLQRNTTSVTTRTSTVLQLGRANSASSAGRVCTLDPRVHPSEQRALGAAAVPGISADGGLAANAASDCGGARFAGRRPLTLQLDEFADALTDA